MNTVVITGANRGIGLALVDAYLARAWHVIATCREPASAEDLADRASSGSLEIEQLDVASGASIEAFAERIADRPLDMLINNAGVYRRTPSLLPFDRKDWEKTLGTNALGALHLTALLVPGLRAAPTRKVVNMSSALGSIAGTAGGSNAYRSSKAALNMGMRTLARELEAEGFTILLMSPGVVDTKLARDVPLAKISPRESAEAMAALIETLGSDRSGVFIRHTGEALAW